MRVRNPGLTLNVLAVAVLLTLARPAAQDPPSAGVAEEVNLRPPPTSLLVGSGDSTSPFVKQTHLVPFDHETRYRVHLDLGHAGMVRQAERLGLESAMLGAKEYEVRDDLYRRLQLSGLPVTVLGGVTAYRFAEQGLQPEFPAARYAAAETEDRAPTVVESTGSFVISSGTVNYSIPDDGWMWVSLTVGSGDAAPAGASTTNLEYRLRIHNDSDPANFYCGDYEIYLSSDARGGSVPHLLVYDNLGGRTDGGYDDDAADDSDIYLDWRSTAHFNDEDPNQRWYVYVIDNWSGDQGYLQYIEFRVHWETPPPDLTVPTVRFTSWTPTEGDPFYIEEDVTNEGGSDAGPSHARLFLSLDNDFDYTDDFEVLPEQSVPELAPGAVEPTRWDFSFPDLADGPSYSVWIVALVDSRDEVAESNESNVYKANNPLTVTDAGGVPDIRVEPLVLHFQRSASAGGTWSSHPPPAGDGNTAASASVAASRPHAAQGR